MPRFTEEDEKKGLKWNSYGHKAEKPLFRHDCENCEFLGTFHGHDLYICRRNQQCVSLLARCGNEENEYVSGIDIFGASILARQDSRMDDDAVVARELIRRAYECNKIHLEIKSS